LSLLRLDRGLKGEREAMSPFYGRYRYDGSRRNAIVVAALILLLAVIVGLAAPSLITSLSSSINVTLFTP
jgi:hypothetical protein